MLTQAPKSKIQVFESWIYVTSCQNIMSRSHHQHTHTHREREREKEREVLRRIEDELELTTASSDRSSNT